MSDSVKTSEPEASTIEESSPHVEKKTPSKRGRMSFIERAQKESEELVKNMGGSLELEGGRRTRSSARGTPSRPADVTPPPVKKSRNSPASPKTTAARARGRGRKLDTVEIPDPPEKKETKDKEEKLDTSAPTQPENDADQEKSDEKPETNGPEKSSGEHDNQTISKEKIADVAVEDIVDKGKPLEKGRKSVDQVDAALEKTLEQQEKKNESPHTVKEVEQPQTVKDEIVPAIDTLAAAADSPMDVDEQSSTQEAIIVQKKESKVNAIQKSSVEEQPKPNVEETIKHSKVEKQPTPEPMEVDSSSKSSDVVECTTDVVDVAQRAVSSTLGEATRSVHPQVETPVLNSFVKASIPNKAEKVDDPVTQSQQAKAEKNGTTGGVDANSVTVNLSLATPVVSEVKSAEVPLQTGDCKIDIKTGNNLNEPKLAAPQLNASGDATVTTI